MAQINLGHVVGQGVPSGGTAGQILKKNGSTNFDTSWATLDGSMVPVSAGDSTTVQQSLAAVKSDMGIVEDGNTATHTIAAGQYVIWKGALYTASAAIPAGTTLSTSNLTAVSGGGLNALNGNIATDWTGAASYKSSLETDSTVVLQMFGKMRSISFQGVARTHTEDEVLFTLPPEHRPFGPSVFAVGSIGANSVILRIDSSNGKCTLYSLNGTSTSTTARIYFNTAFVVN